MSDTQPTVIDFDDGEISVHLNGKELRGWSYTGDDERRQKMLMAREYVEGWCDGRRGHRFYGAECPDYPDCKGGCGLGCTHEMERPSPSVSRPHGETP